MTQGPPLRRRLTLLLEMVVMVALFTWLGMRYLADSRLAPKDSVDFKVQLRDARDKAYLFRNEKGELRYRIRYDDGRKDEDMLPDDFADRVYRDHKSRSWWADALNIASPIGILWVGLGLLGQVLFTGRMVVQWLASEKKNESVVPPIFWWMSLLGSTMLLLYFVWRWDPIGILGQAFGWFIYVRNLWLIYGKTQPPATIGEDPAPEPEL